jgi:hypothetical protein
MVTELEHFDCPQAVLAGQHHRVEALKIAEKLVRLIADIDEIDHCTEWIAPFKHPRLPKASAARFTQGTDKSGHVASLKIRDEPLLCPMTLIRSTGEEEIDLNLAQQPGLTGCKSFCKKRIHKGNRKTFIRGTSANDDNFCRIDVN